jgi:glutaminyl-peptide cyclotransferase
MNLRLFIIFIFFSILVSSFSCSNKPNRSRKPVVQIGIETNRKKITFGDDIRLNIEVKLKDGELKQTKIFVDSVLVTSNENTSFTFTINKFQQLGIHTIKAQAVKADGVEGIYYKTFEVFSDVVPEKYGYEIIQVYPHNETSFTEGLEIHDGFIYESTGENGKSMLYKNILKTGKTVQSIKLADKYFGEGITILNGKIYQLTYKSKIGFVYKLENMALIDSFRFESEQGWGLTHDDKFLIMDDSTNNLTYIDPVTYKTVKKIQVYDDKGPVFNINELEYSDGFIYANIYTTNLIVKIDPLTGKVLSQINLDGIYIPLDPNKPIDYMNGIAIDPITKKMYITGKFYPKLFEIKLVKKG